SLLASDSSRLSSASPPPAVNMFFSSAELPLPGRLSFPTRRSSDLDGARHGDAGSSSDHSGGGGGVMGVLGRGLCAQALQGLRTQDRQSTRLNSRHVSISYAVFRLKQTEHGTTQLVPLQRDLKAFLC